MTEIKGQGFGHEWTRHWRAARTTVVAASGWILALPALARVMHWRRQTVTWVQNILGPITGLVWGRIGWVGVRRYGFSTEEAFVAGGLAGAVTPTFELTLRSLGWPPGSRTRSDIGGDRPPLIAFPLAWFWGFLVGGLVAAMGALVARTGRE